LFTGTYAPYSTGTKEPLKGFRMRRVRASCSIPEMLPSETGRMRKVVALLVRAETRRLVVVFQSKGPVWAVLRWKAEGAAVRVQEGWVDVEDVVGDEIVPVPIPVPVPPRPVGWWTVVLQKAALRVRVVVRIVSRGQKQRAVVVVLVWITTIRELSTACSTFVL
jgi:hypothetical protein